MTASMTFAAIVLALVMCQVPLAPERWQPLAARRAQGVADDQLVVQNAAGLRLFVASEHDDPLLRLVPPGRAASDRSIEIIFPEHVTGLKRGDTEAGQLYRFREGPRGERQRWRRTADALEYARDLAGGVRLFARATLEDDGVRFHYEFINAGTSVYDMIYAVTDPRLTSVFHDPRLERTYVHHADGFDLLASETPGRITMTLDEWLPARYLASYTWPIPERRQRRTDGIVYYTKSRAVDAPFIATLSADRTWVVASFARQAGNVWSNPELTCQHVDPQIALAAGEHAASEVKLLVFRGSLDDALQRAMRQRMSLK